MAFTYSHPHKFSIDFDKIIMHGLCKHIPLSYINVTDCKRSYGNNSFLKDRLFEKLPDKYLWFLNIDDNNNY